jgi:hypothetical protein
MEKVNKVKLLGVLVSYNLCFDLHKDYYTNNLQSVLIYNKEIQRPRTSN